MMSATAFNRTMIGVAGVAYCDFDFDRWCLMLGWDAADPEAQQRFDRLRATYPAVWNWLGTDEFFRRLGEAEKIVRQAFG